MTYVIVVGKLSGMLDGTMGVIVYGGVAMWTKASFGRGFGVGRSSVAVNGRDIGDGG